jgi:lysophospholipase L1-like esterase
MSLGGRRRGAKRERGGVSLRLLTDRGEGVTVWSRPLSGVWLAAVAATVAVVLCACGGPGALAARDAAASRAGVLTVTGPVVALGDSYTAGDLMPLALTSRPFGCLRSSDGYPAQVAKALGATADLVNVSCNGAGVKEMTEPQKTYLGTNPPQLSALAADDSVVMLTLGGDDMGFMNGLQTCMKLSLTDPFGSPCQRHFNRGGTDPFAAQAAAEGVKMVAVLDEIRARAPHARVLLVGYPDLFPQQGGCWPVVPITDGDIGYLRGIETQLNAALAHAAQVAGATFVNTYTPTIGHDFCQSSTVKDVEGLVPTSLAAPFHPNARGQKAIAALVLAAVRAG